MYSFMSESIAVDAPVPEATATVRTEGQPARNADASHRRRCRPGDAGTAPWHTPLCPSRRQNGWLARETERHLCRNPATERSITTDDVTDEMVGAPAFAEFLQFTCMTELPGERLLFDLAIHQCRDPFHCYHLLSLLVPKSGRSRSAIVSRARKILDRTVPMGQFMMVAMSS